MSKNVGKIKLIKVSVNHIFNSHKTDQGRVNIYRKCSPSDFAPIIVCGHYDDYEVVDGNHRLKSLKLNKVKYINVYAIPFDLLDYVESNGIEREILSASIYTLFNHDDTANDNLYEPEVDELIKYIKENNLI